MPRTIDRHLDVPCETYTICQVRRFDWFLFSFTIVSNIVWKSWAIVTWVLLLLAAPSMLSKEIWNCILWSSIVLCYTVLSIVTDIECTFHFLTSFVRHAVRTKQKQAVSYTVAYKSDTKYSDDTVRLKDKHHKLVVDLSTSATAVALLEKELAALRTDILNSGVLISVSFVISLI